MKIYELQNIGKGIINNLYEENFLLIEESVSIPTLDQVMYADGGNVRYGHIINVFQDIQWGTEEVAEHKSVQEIRHSSLESYPFYPLNRIGSGIGGSNTERSLAFYKDKTVFRDTKYNKGLEYDGDYEANFTDRSLVTKQYVSGVVSGVVRELTAELASWKFDRQYAIILHSLPADATIKQVVLFLKCISPSHGYTIGDIINAPTPEVNDSGGLSPQGIGLIFQHNSAVINLMIDGRLAIKEGYNSTPAAPVIATNLSDPTKWNILLSILYTV